MCRFRRNFGREFAERRRVIEHGDAAPMRRDREIGRARMNLNIIHAHRRYIADSDPMRALIERREQSEVRSGVKQLRIHQIFANDFHRSICRQIADD